MIRSRTQSKQVKLSCNQGFSLVEVAIALGITIFCVFAILGLLLSGSNSYQASFQETTATGILSAVVTDLRTTSTGTTTSARFAITFPATSVSTTSTFGPVYFNGDGTESGTITPSSRYRLSVTFQPPTAPQALVALVTVSWPAAATPLSSVRQVVAINRN